MLGPIERNSHDKKMSFVRCRPICLDVRGRLYPLGRPILCVDVYMSTHEPSAVKVKHAKIGHMHLNG